jgi:asparagine synthase (glutamine-hydrolysing)
MSRLLTRERVEGLGFVAWEKVEGLVGRAFAERDAGAMRFAFVVAQWVVLGERFGIKKAGPRDGGSV